MEYPYITRILHNKIKRNVIAYIIADSNKVRGERGGHALSLLSHSYLFFLFSKGVFFFFI